MIVFKKTTSVFGRLTCFALVFAVLPFGIDHAVHGQMTGDSMEGLPHARNFFAADDFTLWISHVDGRGVGDTMSNTAVGANRFQFLDNGVRMFTAEFQMTEFGDPDLSLGCQHRFWLNDNLAAGVGFYFDAMESFYGNTFQQTGVNFEVFMDDWTVRSNVTLPVGSVTRNVVNQTTMSNNQPIFQGNLIGTRQQSFRLDETAMRGVDIEIARSVGNTNGEVFVGYHNFDSEIGPHTDGINGGFRGNITHNLATNVGISDDPLFGTNVFGGFTWFFGNGASVAPRTIAEKMTIPVVRDDQVVINEVQTQNFSSFEPLTSRGQVITFNHVNSGVVNGDGSFENPFGTLDAADNDPDKNNRQIIYAHSGSSFNNQAYALAPNQRFIGEGDNNNHVVQTDQLGVVTIPQVNGNQFARPVISGASVGLFANVNTQISNLQFQNSNTGIRANNVGGNVDIDRTRMLNNGTGIGILGGTGSFTFSDTEIDGSSVDGVRASGFAGNMNVIRSLVTGGDVGIDIVGGAGTFTFSDTDISDQADAGINVTGGNSTISFDGLTSNNQATGGSALRVGSGHIGQVTFDVGSDIGSTSGDGLQFSHADGMYDFRGEVTLNGGDAGIDILGGSAGTFTFTHTEITDPTGDGITMDGGSADVTFSSVSSIVKNNPGGRALNVRGGHSGRVLFDTGTSITATDGDGLQFDNADGEYDFRGQVQLNGGDAGIDILGGSAGTFTFTDTTISNPAGDGINIDGGSSTFTFDGLSSISKTNAGSSVKIGGGHGGTVTFNAGTGITATGGDGLQFDDADGEYDFRGQVQLNGGDAGIDIIGGSAGTFTFSDTTTITNPTGSGFKVQDLEAGGTVNYNGSIQNDNDVFVDIDTTAAGTQVNFNNTGANSLTSTDNPNGAIFIFDGDGDITITTPTTIIRPGFSSLFATDGDGTWTFNDLTITDQMGLNGGVDIFGQMGVVNFTNLNITTDSAGTGDATTAFLAGGNQNINVTGNSNLNADGGGALVLINIGQIDMSFDTITATNNLNSQVGFAGDDGIEMLNVAGGTLDVTGLTTIHNVDGVAISLEDVDADVTLNMVDIDTTGLDAIIAAVVFDNTGELTINGGTISNVGANDFRVGSTAGGGSGGFFNLNNTTFTNITGVIGRAANSTFSGAGNTAAAFSCTDNGGNTGSILFNGGVDSCPN